jgi:single-strand DNA-binding protein
MNETVITVVGNLTGDPELRFTPTGTAMCRFTIASTPRTYDKASGEWRDGEALFLPVTAWRDLAENIAGSLGKAARVIVTGRLRLSRWETPEGEKRSMMQLDADECGPSLRWATATINRLSRNGNGSGPAEPDPWLTATPAGATAGHPDDSPEF